LLVDCTLPVAACCCLQVTLLLDNITMSWLCLAPELMNMLQQQHCLTALPTLPTTFLSMLSSMPACTATLRRALAVLNTDRCEKLLRCCAAALFARQSMVWCCCLCVVFEWWT
jgi:hypothetical protein